MELNISERWHHPAHAHGGQCPHQAVPTGAHVGRMSAELAAGRALGGVIATAWFGIAAHALSVRQFGQLALVLSLGSLVSIGTDLGIPLALTKLSCDHDTLDRGAVMGAVRRRVRAGETSPVGQFPLPAETACPPTGPRPVASRTDRPPTRHNATN